LLNGWGSKTTQIYPEDGSKYVLPKHKKKPYTLSNVKSTTCPSFEEPYNTKYFFQIRVSLW
jgi:hypothetical protein